jgi:TetR/AcrR family transcriptional repressor of nem operon
MPKPSLKEAFLDAGMLELHTRGYSATGVSSVAERAGGPKGSFYNHFGSKEDFAVAVIGRYAEGRRLEMLTDPSVPPLDRIRAHFAHLQADLAAHDYARGCMFGNFAAEVAGTNERLRGVVDFAFDRWATLLAGAIDEARTAGEVSTDLDPAATAQLLIDAWEGAALRAKATGNSTPLDNVLALAFTVLLAPTRKD